ncbi:hypothetical protein [Haloarcula onubensis]|uniref:PGF-CTERM sorting domain-containing protein n=1 Tax=Haloarcula onubensis TaxID=2950539 RepID=A0ABU2FSF5_9EURY|nr:hypothetical protein [Halomicroarcula sp. S3CR25-11]MDS0283696.1 hypothetical protein [Halomicroarcula sp. S3CR25-11]
MRYKALTLVVAALLALGAGGVTAASLTNPTADAASADALPANYTVDVVNPDGVSDEAAEQAIETAWANDDVRSHLDGTDAVHFEVWASELDDDTVYVDVAPIDSPEETLVRAHVDVARQTVTATDEPVTLDASNATSITASGEGNVSVNGTDYELNPDAETPAENATRYTAEQSTEFQINASAADSQSAFRVTTDTSEDDP